MVTRRYFYTLDALRTLAFLTVFLAHLPLKNNPVVHFFTASGGLRVTFFFVLSGFLITYILLVEKKKRDKIHLKKFFIRRALRIWPLFYAMLLFAFLTPFILEWLNLPFSSEGYEPNWLLSALFLENYVMMFTENTPNVSPLLVTWSLCIDEHFYIVWGVLFYFIPMRKIHWIFILSIGIGVLTRIIYSHYSVLTLDLFSYLDYFAFGAIPAYLIVQKEAVIEKLGRSPLVVKVVLIVSVFATLLFFSNYHLPGQIIYTPLILGFLYCGVIAFTLVQSGNKISIYKISLLNKLSPYTYGLYLFHTIFINLFLQLFDKFEISLYTTWGIFGLGSAALACSILASIISYHFFEAKFLLLKKYFY